MTGPQTPVSTAVSGRKVVPWWGPLCVCVCVCRQGGFLEEESGLDPRSSGLQPFGF